MLRNLRSPLAPAVAAALALGLGGAPAQGVSTSSTNGGSSTNESGLPEGAPAAATQAEPELDKPKGWPFAQRVSRTSGTERLHG
jgi:hypothetical protein